jgi:DNA primase
MVIDRIRKLDSPENSLSESYLDMFDSNGPGEYWSNRFSLDACQRFRLGYDEAKEKSVYPIRDSNGRLLGLVYRNFPGEKPKYRYPKGVRTSELLFNWDRVPANTPIVLVEGAPDVIALWEVGVPAIGSYGARLLPAQQRLLSRLSPSVVIVAYDMDQAGHQGSRQAIEALMRLGIPAVRAWWRGYNDVGEMPGEIARDTIEKTLARGLTLV